MIVMLKLFNTLSHINAAYLVLRGKIISQTTNIEGTINIFMLRILLLLLFLTPLITKAQFTYVVDQTVSVKGIDNKPLKFPWAGGLNAAQYNSMDLNEDGADDLVLFDRMANKVITYVNVDNDYHYAPEYENLFPLNINNFLLLRDYNCDGRKDIFTSDPLGIRVYRNETGGWKPFVVEKNFNPDTQQTDTTFYLLTQGVSDKVNIYLNDDDLPAIVDADGDGDLDIFNMRFTGNGSIEFHQNMSIETFGTCDSLNFKRVSQTWGNVKECTCGVFAFNGEDCPTGGRTKHAGGKALLALDVDGDHQQDILFSEATCMQSFLLHNDGTLLSPVINTSSNFPASNPINFYLFPAAFFEDVDFDGIKDLISAPNISTKASLAINLAHSNWFYKNTGSNTLPSFSLIKNNLLQDEMIDVGDNAVPAFIDYDGDGDLDMLISQNASDIYSASIFLFENKGDISNPSFQLITENYLEFSSLGYYNLKIQFIDLDHNSTPDLVFTATSLETNSTNLFYVNNLSSKSLNFSNQFIQPIDFNVTSNETLHFTDVDADGYFDILAGRSNGALEYWKSSGQSSPLTYTLTDDKFLGLSSLSLRQNISCSTGDLDADGNTDLILGDQNGSVSIVSDYKAALDVSGEIKNIVFNPLLKTYTNRNLGGPIWPTVANLYHTNKPAIVVGNILGGLQILRNDDGLFTSGNPVIDVYPNPVKETDVINVKIDRPAYLQVISVLGKQLSPPILLQANQAYQYQHSLAAGVYILKFTVNKKNYSKRVVIH
jgi:hypothetical protein